MYIESYKRTKFPGERLSFKYRIAVDHLRRAGFWHRDLRQPQARRVYYEDMVHLEEQALLLLTRLDHMR